MSSAYSGIGTVEQASHQICHNLSSSPDCGTHTVKCMWVLEKDAVCQAELAAYFSGCNTCVFGNLKELVKNTWWTDLGFGHDAEELPPSELYTKGLNRSTLNLNGLACAACDHHRPRGCTLMSTDMHVAGTTCVDHSNYGSCKGDEGKNVKFFLIWAALMRQLRPRIILHENVAGFGTFALTEVLADLYVVCPSVSCASLMGYPIRRKRQMTIIVLKSWLYPQLREAGLASYCNPYDVQRIVDLQHTLDAISRRPCNLTWKHFIIASPSDAAEEIAEAAARPGAVQRWADIAAGRRSSLDKNGNACRLFAVDLGCPVLEALLPRERERIETVLWQAHPGADVVDVSQNPTERARTIKRDEPTFMTVIAGSGYFVRTDMMRQQHHSTTLVTAVDVLSMSGFPITDEQVASAGTPCMFSSCRASSAPAARSARSMRKQVGNAMHFTHVGLVFLAAILKFPRLGEDSAAAHSISDSSSKRSADSAVASASGSSMAESSFLRAVRARRGKQ